MSDHARPPLSAKEQARRREAVARAAWHNRMAGLGKPDPEHVALSERWITGEISEEEYEALVWARVKARVGKRKD